MEGGLVQYVDMKILRIQRYARFVERIERNQLVMQSPMKKTIVNNPSLPDSLHSAAQRERIMIDAPKMPKSIFLLSPYITEMNGFGIL